MLSELSELEPRLKEILYRCLEEVRATKAALYVHSNNNFEVVTQYGFTPAPRRQVAINDVVVDRLGMRRAAFFVNGLTSEPRFSEILFASKTDRILVAPMYSRGKLIGFLDLRDKAGRQPFEPADLDEVKRIAEQFVDFFAQRGLFGAEPLATTAASDAGSLEAPSSAAKTIEIARVAVARDVERFRPAVGAITEDDLAAVQQVLPTILALPGATAAVFSAYGQAGSVKLTAARSTLTPEALTYLQSKIQAWVKAKGSDWDPGTRNHMLQPLSTSAPPLGPQQLGSILTAPVVGAMKCLALTVTFETPPQAETRKHLERFLQIIQTTVEDSGCVRALRAMRQKAAEKLLEPDFQKFPELVEHCKKVSLLADQFAHYLNLAPVEIENVRLSGLLHDVGMRLLDYARLYRKDKLSSDELKTLREHSVVGAAIVAPVFGAEFAQIVLSHHERADGRGYPAGIAGETIPLAARVLQICDAFDAMTSPHSYQEPLPEEAAVKQILRMGGAEFDHNLATKFKDMVGR